ncbi:hypothetical protein GCM10022210_56490 [Mucilaginibacter dorajii]|uniref:Polysaccharide biosynthesis protein C-terminal domain-containing protein n=2 Tax=Mucilaginibacter dorajii TaxID=692994 RepID=A0ABP7RCK8_9SPHI
MSIAAFAWAYKLYKVKMLKVSLSRIFLLLWEEKMIFISLVVISLYTTTNVVILGLFKDNEQVGYYTAAQKLIDVAGAVISFPLAQTLFPFIGGAFNEDFNKGIETTKKIFPIIILLAAAFSIFLFFIGPIVLLWFYGQHFAQSISIIKILAFVPLIVSINNFFCIQVMLNLKMDKEFFFVTVGGAIVGLILNLCMVRYTGSVGTAWNWLVVETVITLCAYIILRFKNIDLIDFNHFKPNNILIHLQSVVSNFNDKVNK